MKERHWKRKQVLLMRTASPCGRAELFDSFRRTNHVVPWMRPARQAGDGFFAGRRGDAAGEDAGVSANAAGPGRGRRVLSDRRGVRFQRLAHRNAGSVRLPRSRVGSSRPAFEEENRPAPSDRRRIHEGMARGAAGRKRTAANQHATRTADNPPNNHLITKDLSGTATPTSN